MNFFFVSFFLFFGRREGRRGIQSWRGDQKRLSFRIKPSTDIGGDDGLIRLGYRIHLCRVTDLSLFLIPSNKKRADNKTGSNRLSEEMHAAEGGSVSRVSTFNCRFDILQDETICVGEFSNGGDRSVIRGWAEFRIVFIIMIIGTMVLERVEISFWQIVCCHTIAIFRNTYIKGNEKRSM